MEGENENGKYVVGSRTFPRLSIFSVTALRFCVGILVLCTVLHADEGGRTEPHQATPSEVEHARKRYLDNQKSLPIEQQPVRYIEIGEGRFVPAQFDLNANRELRWKGVLLTSSQLPRLGWSGSFGIWPIRPSGFPIQEIEPPVRYFELRQRGKFAAGYYDASNRIFYRWKGVELDRDDLSKDPSFPRMILDAEAVVDMPFVEAPKHAVAGRLPAE